MKIGKALQPTTKHLLGFKKTEKRPNVCYNNSVLFTIKQTEVYN